MKVFIDTNVLISAALFPGSTPYQAYVKAVSFPNQGVICDQNIEELNRIFHRKFPNKIDALNAFLATALISLEVVPIPELLEESEDKIRDEKDRPILRAAMSAEVDVIISGDKDFLESGLEHPIILSPAAFLK